MDVVVTGKRMVPLNDLPKKGICYSKTHLRRLYESDRFPKPFKLSPRKLVWWESELDAWLAEKERESAEESA